MKLLEKYISENRASFDLDDPDPGHFGRFMEKQQERIRERPVRFKWGYLMRAAAVIILVVISSLWVYEKFRDSVSGDTFITLSDISPEYMEAEVYYTSLINRKYSEIKSIEFQGNSKEQEVLLKELAEMDAVYRSLEEELNTEKGNQMVISAMIRHYQLKLEIMNHILTLLNQAEKEESIKNEDNENIKV